MNSSTPGCRGENNWESDQQPPLHALVKEQLHKGTPLHKLLFQVIELYLLRR